jgi:serine/threonine-protein kinase
MALRNFETADKVLDRAIAASPQSFQARALKPFMAVLWKGDLSAAEEVFSSNPPETDPNGLMTWGRAWILTLARKFPEALQVLERFRGETMYTTTTAPSPKAYLEGMIHLLQGDKIKAQAELEHARVVSEKLLREAPGDSARHAQHGLILAALGQKEEAIAEGKRAVELLPESQDALDGRKEPLRWPRFMLGPGNPMKHFACSIICSGPEHSHRPDAQARSRLGPAPQRPALPGFDR